MEDEVWDGKHSIEHQLDIHINDLLQCAPYGEEVYEILCGLQYVLEYRIGCGKLVSLSPDICGRLVRALLLATNARLRRSRFQQLLSEATFTRDAELAFVLLVDFVIRIPECLGSLLQLPTEELAKRLQLGKRIAKPSTLAISSASLDLLNRIAPTHEWKSFVNIEDIEVVEGLLQKQGKPFPLQSPNLNYLVHPPQSLYFDRGVERILDMFQTSITHGLSSEQVRQSHAHYGRNELPKPQEKSLLRALISQLSEFMIIILTITSIVSAITDWPRIESTLTLVIVILLNVGVGLWQEHKSSQTIASMKDLQIPMAIVRRDGTDAKIPALELVPGDVVILSEGDLVPADLRLVKCAHLELQESILTGESMGVPKSTRPIRIPNRRLQIPKCRGNVFMGTLVTRGTGAGVVVRVGASTEIGQIGHALSANFDKPLKSPLQKKMTILGRYLVLSSLLLCAIVFGAGLVQHRSMEEMLRLSVSLAVSVIPEGLLAILTVSMALSIRRMAKQNVLVKRLNAVESLGAVSLIASDKTGTLTEGKIRFQTYWDSDGDRPGSMAFKILVLCNNASLNHHGDPTELALLDGASSFQAFDFMAVRGQYRRALEIPFDSDRKMMSVVVEDEKGLTRELLVKGAPEVVLGRCSFVQNNGNPCPLTDEVLRTILEAGEQMSNEGLRLLALACRESIPALDVERLEADEQLYSESVGLLEKDLCFVGLVGLVDPPRPGVAKSITDCRAAGIKVIMITGDSDHTARSIAQKLGIYDPAIPELSRVFRSQDIDLLSIQELAQLQPFPCVFARVSPKNKLSIVQALRMRGEQVAMTGDGVNDAPAIRHADVGIAMGLNGTQITRDAASVILLEDNFQAIIKGIAQGRQMYQNVARFLTYLLSCNSAEIWTVLGALVLGWESPLAPMAILWANIIADIPPSLSLSLERDSEATLMRDRPREVPAVIMGPATWVLIAVNGATLSSLTLLGFGPAHGQKSLVTRRSEAFLSLIGLQLILALLSRSRRESCLRVGIFGNVWLLLAVLLSFSLLLAGLYIPFLYKLLELEPVTMDGWVRFVVSMLIMIIVNEMAKLAIRRMRWSS